MLKIFRHSFKGFKTTFDSLFLRLEKFFWSIANEAFLSIMIFMLCSALLTEVIFYHYFAKVTTEESRSEIPIVQFKDDIYQSVMQQWRVKRQKILHPPADSLFDPFLQ